MVLPSGSAGGQNFISEEHIIAANSEIEVRIEFQPDQLIATCLSGLANGIDIFPDGVAGDAGIPLRGIGPVYWPGVKNPQILRIANLDPVERVLRLIAQKGYTPLSLNLPTTEAAAITLGEWQTLTYTDPLSWSVAGGNGDVTLTGSPTFANPTDVPAGATVYLLVKQDGTGGRTITSWGSNFQWAGGAVPILSWQADAVDLLTWETDDNGLLYFRGIERQQTDTFSPTNIAQLGLWLYADSLTSLADGDSVASWLDQSGNARNATQGVAAARPQAKDNIVNGHRVVRFDGVDDRLLTAWAEGKPQTVFVVYAQRSATPGSARRAFAGDANTGDNNWFHGPRMDTYQFWTNEGIMDGPAVQPGVFKLSTSVQTGALTEFWINDSSQGTLGSMPVPAGAYVIGSGEAAGNAFEPTDCDVAEIVVYGSQLSIAQQAEVTQYLRNKYTLW